jgi:hypothetical protein
MALSPNRAPSPRAFVLFCSGRPLDRHERPRRRTRMGPDRSAEARPRRAFFATSSGAFTPSPASATAGRGCQRAFAASLIAEDTEGQRREGLFRRRPSVRERSAGRETEGETLGGKGSPAEIKRRSSSNWSTSGGALSRTPGECDRSRGVKSASIAMRVAVSTRPALPGTLPRKALARALSQVHITSAQAPGSRAQTLSWAQRHPTCAQSARRTLPQQPRLE